MHRITELKDQLLELTTVSNLENGSNDFKHNRHALLSMASALLLTTYKPSLQTDVFQQRANQLVRSLSLSKIAVDHPYLPQVKSLLATKSSPLTNAYVARLEGLLQQIFASLSTSTLAEAARLHKKTTATVRRKKSDKKLSFGSTVVYTDADWEPSTALMLFSMAASTFTMLGIAAVTTAYTRPRF